MVDVQGNGSGHRPLSRPGNRSPLPVPELPTDEGLDVTELPPLSQPSQVVTDEERNRFGALLDRAAERGLIGPADYQVRLRELAEATSTEEMTKIVSEFPTVTTPPARRSKGPAVGPVAADFGTVQRSEPPRAAPWGLLIMVVAAVILALVILSVFAEHTLHEHSGGQPAPTTLSVPRL